MKIKNCKDKINKLYDQLIEFVFPIWLPIIAIIFLIIVSIFHKHCENIYSQVLALNFYIDKIIFKEELLGSLLEIPIVLLGIYITIISVFGIGFSKATILVAQNNKSGYFIKYAQTAIISAIMLLVSTIVYDLISLKIWTLIYLDFLIWCLANFVRFIIITMKMYTINIKEANNEAIKADEKVEELITKLNKVISEKSNQDITSDEYFNRVAKANQEKTNNS